MFYDPQPIDTSHIALPAEAEGLLERLAENAHEIWARERMDEGWRYAETKDAEALRTPLLVPYAELSESEKELDRKMVREALKATLAEGWSLAPTSAAPAPDLPPPAEVAAWERDLRLQAAEAGRRGTFDMDDGPELESEALDEGGRFAGALRFLQTELQPVWARHDRVAQRQHRTHRWVALTAIVFGTAALVCSIIGLVWPKDPFLGGLGSWGEVISVGSAMIAVAAGLKLGFHHRWLASRQIAERLRGLKFQSLADARIWTDPDGWQADVRQRIQALQGIDAHTAKAWCEQDTPRPDVDEPDAGDAPRTELLQLARYYHHKRLDFQEAYFRRRHDQLHQATWSIRLHLPLVLFFGSVVCVLAHKALHAWSHDASPFVDGLSTLLLALGAILPILGFGLRAWLAAFEVPRQAALFRAKATALDEAERYLEDARLDPVHALERIAQDEQFFEDEHREWCRLQFAAEWFI